VGDGVTVGVRVTVGDGVTLGVTVFVGMSDGVILGVNVIDGVKVIVGVGVREGGAAVDSAVAMNTASCGGIVAARAATVSLLFPWQPLKRPIRMMFILITANNLIKSLLKRYLSEIARHITYALL
jgi:hypothetical protein